MFRPIYIIAQPKIVGELGVICIKHLEKIPWIASRKHCKESWKKKSRRRRRNCKGEVGLVFQVKVG